MGEEFGAYSDLGLARRLERCEASGNAGFVEARAALAPESGAGWMEFGGTYAMFDGRESPITQTFGLGLFETTSDENLALIEQFFVERGAHVFHEVSPLAGIDTFRALDRRLYAPVELTSVLYRPIEPGLQLPLPPANALKVSRVGDMARERWLKSGQGREWLDQTIGRASPPAAD